MTHTPPGWYPAPDDSTRQRWWDGTQWTDAHQPRPELPRPRSKAPWIALIVAAAIVVPGIGLGVTVLGGAIGLASEFDRAQQKLDSLYIYALRERPGYGELVDRYASVQRTYEDMYDSGEIYSIVPNTEAGKDYYYSFRELLSLRSSNLELLAATVSTDAQELDDQIGFLDGELTELIGRFEANEGLDDSVAVVDQNGNTVAQPGSAVIPATDEALDFVAAYQGQPDANGSYAAAASEMIEPFGMYLTWVNGTGHSACNSGSDSPTVVAYYCRLEPQIIYINQSTMDDSDRNLLDTVRHELAHHLIGELCGAVSPPAAGGRAEATANSFALLYLGLSEKYISYMPSEYAVDDASRAAAEAIHSGDCG